MVTALSALAAMVTVSAFEAVSLERVVVVDDGEYVAAVGVDQVVGQRQVVRERTAQAHCAQGFKPDTLVHPKRPGSRWCCCRRLPGCRWPSPP